MGANWTLSFAVLSFGLLYQQFLSHVLAGAREPAWPRVVSKIMWIVLAAALGFITRALWSLGYSITISLVLCVVAVISGCVLGAALARLEDAIISRRGERAYRRVMAGREKD